MASVALLLKKFTITSALLILLGAALQAQPETGRPGEFDYYLLTLSWSPEYCHTHPGASECGGHYGFIVHGLWPQFLNGHYPEKCSTEPAPHDIPAVAGIMPNASLIVHEWITHGTCSGLSADQYFALIRQTFESIKIPSPFVSPSRSVTMHPAEVKQAFQQSNPKISDSSIAVNCPQNFLGGVQICVAKNGTPMSCPPNATRDCHANTIRVPPVK